MASPYQIGTLVTLRGEFKNSSGTLSDPTSVVCQLRDPQGTETTPSVTNVSTGVYEATVVPTLGGKWRYRFEGDGAVEVSGEGEFEVLKSIFSTPG